MRSIPRAFWVLAGSISLALGIIGAFLPLVPTTPFVLLSAYCYSKGSPRCHAWLISHRFFGPMIRDWEKNQVIRRKTKVLATVSTLIMVGFPVVFLAIPVFAKLIMVGCAGTALVFVWFQKEE